MKHAGFAGCRASWSLFVLVLLASACGVSHDGPRAAGRSGLDGPLLRAVDPPALPPGHPPIDGRRPTLPPGHPVFPDGHPPIPAGPLEWPDDDAMPGDDGDREVRPQIDPPTVIST
jgi:hypothetical protein